MRKSLLAAALLLLAASPSHAAAPTVGWEWEVNPWSWVTIDKGGNVVPDQKNNECPSKLFTTSTKSPVDANISLVSFTRDLSGSDSQTLEITTGPIEYDSDPDVDRIMLVMQAFAEAAETCTESHGQCRIGIQALTQHMQNNAIMQNAGPGGSAITFVTQPAVNMFNNSGKECVLVWNRTYDTNGTNTQTNVGLTFLALWTGGLGNLFSGVDDQSSGWQVSARAYRKALELGDSPPPVTGMSLGLASGRARGVFALLAYLVNAETYSDHYKKNVVKEGWEGWQGKNVQDVYLKTPPDELVSYVKGSDEEARKFFDALQGASEHDKAALATFLCVARTQAGTPLDCRAKLDAMIALLKNADQASYLNFIPQIPNPIAMFTRYERKALVVEARRMHNPLNEKGTFVRLPSGKFDLKDRTWIRDRLKGLSWSQP